MTIIIWAIPTPAFFVSKPATPGTKTKGKIRRTVVTGNSTRIYLWHKLPQESGVVC